MKLAFAHVAKLSEGIVSQSSAISGLTFRHVSFILKGNIYLL
jgi:hypothetical protein